MSEELKIGVIGVGGVGGYLAAVMSSSLPGVTVVARGERGRAIKEKGLILHSDHKGELVGHPAVVGSVSELGDQDVIFICVKNYSLEDVLAELQPVTGEGTILVPVMNGVDPGERVQKALPGHPVVESVIYIVSFSDPAYEIIQQGDFADLRIGVTERTPENLEALEKVKSVLQQSGLDHRAVEDIEAAIWEKYILNCAYNVCTAAYDNDIGTLRKDPEKAAEFEAAAKEAAALAAAKKVKVRKDIGDRVIYRFHHVFADTDTSSLQRDLRDGKPSEADTFCGYVVREADRLGLPVPAMKKLYGIIKEKAGTQ